MFGNVGNHMLKHNTVSIELLLFYFIIIICYPVDEEDTDDDTTHMKEEKKVKPAQLIMNHKELGWPLIPRKDNMSLDELKAVVRAYVTGTYCKFFFNINRQVYF
jgi:hypothetical protein